MNIVFIGSIALSNRGIIRRPNDIDVICSYDDFVLYAGAKTCKRFYPSSGAKKLIAQNEVNTMLECEVTWDDSNAKELFDLIVSDPNTKTSYTGACSGWNGKSCTFYYPSIDVLYMLKMSHRYLRNSPAFSKTMNDIQELREAGAKFDERYSSWYYKRVAETYHYEHPSLNKNKSEFFDDTVQYVYDHDTIHEAVKMLDRPAYTFYMKDGAEVLTDMNKFDACDEIIRLYGVLEESYVLAIERHQVPNDYKPNPRDSFLIALEKVCTSITSGKFREFAWENYDKVIALYDDNYVDKFKKALYDGNIKSFTRGY